MGDPSYSTENDGGPWEIDQMLVPQPLQVRRPRKTGYPDDVNPEEPFGGDYRISLGSSGCYWQSDSWQMFKSLEDSVYDSVYDFPRVDVEVCDEPEFSGMDLEPLRRLQRWLAEDEGTEPSEYAKPTGRVPLTTGFGMLISGDGDGIQDTDGLRQLSRKLSKHTSWYADLLSDIVNHQSTIDPIAVPHVLSNHVITTPRVREQMREKWKRMYKVALAPQRAEIRRRIRKAGNAADKQGIKTEKARMMRRVLKKIVADELSEVARALRWSLEGPLCEIESLYAFFLAQQHLFLRSHTPPSRLITIQDQQHSSLAQQINETAPFLSTQLDAIDSVFDIGLRTIAIMGTRISRVAAKDVLGAVEREEESKRRLQDPAVVMGYLAKVEDDCRFLKLWAKTAESSFMNIDKELTELAEGIVDLFVVGEACVLFAED
ncbi:MAG: hypothetical protein M1840_006235 [Geoglossum simile]|nr:MAG: hypothetical protein M1840_006235 [Geoglossum simile]